MISITEAIVDCNDPSSGLASPPVCGSSDEGLLADVDSPGLASPPVCPGDDGHEATLPLFKLSPPLSRLELLATPPVCGSSDGVLTDEVEPPSGLPSPPVCGSSDGTMSAESKGLYIFDFSLNSTWKIFEDGFAVFH